MNFCCLSHPDGGFRLGQLGLAGKGSTSGADTGVGGTEQRLGSGLLGKTLVPSHSLLPGQRMTSVVWPPAARAYPDQDLPNEHLGLA